MNQEDVDFKWKTSKNSEHVGSRRSSDQILEIDDLWPMQVSLNSVCLDRDYFQRCRVNIVNVHLKFFREGFPSGGFWVSQDAERAKESRSPPKAMPAKKKPSSSDGAVVCGNCGRHEAVDNREELRVVGDNNNGGRRAGNGQSSGRQQRVKEEEGWKSGKE